MMNTVGKWRALMFETINFRLFFGNFYPSFTAENCEALGGAIPLWINDPLAILCDRQNH
jgi:hypothetical protein